MFMEPHPLAGRCETPLRIVAHIGSPALTFFRWEPIQLASQT
jgi:hypothetical protein